jgi:hypothetical protein
MNQVKEYNPFFEVTRKPLFTEFNDERIRSNRDALINPELKCIVGEVSKNYKVVENKEIANVFDEVFSDVEDKFVTDHLNANTGKWVREIILNDPEYGFVVNGNDECKIKISVFNGYTGNKGVGFYVSAYRLVCKNGLMGWRNILSVSIPHIKEGIVDFIRDSFHEKINILREKVEIFEDWSDERFTKEDFDLFIDTREKLSDKMKENLKGYWNPIMNKFNESETKWGAYNVLTAIATHYTEARKGSNLFSNAYKRIEKLVDELMEFDPEDYKKIDKITE